MMVRKMMHILSIISCTVFLLDTNTTLGTLYHKKYTSWEIKPEKCLTYILLISMHQPDHYQILDDLAILNLIMTGFLCNFF